MQFQYFINLNERGEFRADVRNPETEESIFEIEGYEIFQDGFMRHARDLCGLRSYLRELGIISAQDTVMPGN